MASERGLLLAEKIWNWRPYSDTQRDFILCTAPTRVGCFGRRGGKSTACAVDVVLWALENPHTIQMILGPTDKHTTIIMDEVRRFLLAVPGLAGSLRDIRSSGRQEITFRDGGGLVLPTTIMARTVGTDGGSVRGLRAHRVVVDECAMISDRIMQAAVRPLLADFGDYPGSAMILISTPKGSNHFRAAYNLGLDPLEPRYASFHCPSTANPHLSAAYLAEQRDKCPERVWAEEYLAEFQDDQGGVFRGVAECVDKGRSVSDPTPGVRFFLGVDLAKVNDFTVISVIDAKGRQVFLDRFNKIPWEQQVARIKAASDKYNNAPALVDSTGVGDPVLENIIKAGVKATGYHLTHQSKTKLIDNLAIRIEKRQVSLLDNPVQTGELTAYEYTISPSRNLITNAPADGHDDTVISLALSCMALSQIRFATAL